MKLSILIAAVALTAHCLSAQAPPAGAQGGGGRGRGTPRYVEATPVNFNDHEGWIQMFDGKTLNGWDGPKDLWHVEDGAIVVHSKTNPPTGSTYMLWDGGEVANFEFRYEVKLDGARANSGIQFRGMRLAEVAGRPASKYETRGYQADFDNYGDNVGALIECCSGASRPDLPRVRPDRASAGQVVRTAVADGQLPATLMTFGTDRATMMKAFKPGEWNQMYVVARGNVLMYSINGQLMSVLIDDNPTRAFAKGWIAIQLEGSGENTASWRNLWIKKLP
jgi:hypothetical protein